MPSSRLCSPGLRILLGVSALCGNALAQTAPDLTSILENVGDTYSAAQKYEMESSIEIQLPNNGGTKTYAIHMWLSGPEKYRIQTSGDVCPPTLNSDCPPGIHELLMVYRLGTEWAYSPATNEYRQHQAPNLQRDTRPEDVDLYFGVGIFRHAPQAFTTGRLLREDRITINGQSIDCQVVEVRMASSATTLWIDKNTHFVRRMESGAEGYSAKVDYRLVRINEPLADDLFDFKPPSGARKTDTAFGQAKPK
jgi:outer membrane lipoprotein-sorting protein